ncbi:MAG: metabolite traffic protein EboE [Planctomycetota bacterium]
MTRSSASLPNQLTTPSIVDWTIGYCTNVHPGTDSESIVQNIQGISADVRRRHRTTQLRRGEETDASVTKRVANDSTSLGLGLWLPAEATTQVRRTSTEPIREALRRHQLLPFTINGFPYANFHQDRVKHDVYRPTWWNDDRVAYTRDLAKILTELMPDDVLLGSISTLPIGWPRQPVDDGTDEWIDASKEQLLHAGTNLRRIAEDLRMLEDRSGKRVVLAIEPEPGCVIDTSAGLVEWFQRELPEPTHRRYVGVCHDICHSAVMNESPSDVLRRYADADILVGKLQVSSAVVADWQSIAPEEHAVALEQMAGFAEDRYLHQTGVIDSNGQWSLSEDLSDLISRLKHDGTPSLPLNDRRWTTHFHVPIFVETFDSLCTTQSAIRETIQAIVHLSQSGQAHSALRFTGHVEVETYAWSVLPESMRRNGLAADIARELDWLTTHLEQWAAD